MLFEQDCLNLGAVAVW